MGCLLTSAIFECDDFHVGGIKRLFLTNRSSITNYYYDVSDFEKTTVSSLLPATGVTWYEYSFNPFATGADDLMNLSLFGRSYTHSFRTEINGLSQSKRDTLNELIDSDDILLIFQESDGNWRIMGEDIKLKVIEYTETTGASNEDGPKYTLNIGNTTKYRMRYIDSSFINNYILPYYTNGSSCVYCYQILPPVILQSISSVALNCILTCPLS